MECWGEECVLLELGVFGDVEFEKEVDLRMMEVKVRGLEKGVENKLK